MHERRKQKESQASTFIPYVLKKLIFKLFYSGPGKISFLNTIDSCPIRLSEPARYLLAQGTVRVSNTNNVCH